MPLPEHLTPAENLFNRAARTCKPLHGARFYGGKAANIHNPALFSESLPGYISINESISV
jgi:hypothetical protein